MLNIRFHYGLALIVVIQKFCKRLIIICYWVICVCLLFECTSFILKKCLKDNRRLAEGKERRQRGDRRGEKTEERENENGGNIAPIICFISQMAETFKSKPGSRPPP